MGTSRRDSGFRVLLDGEPPQDAHGVDVDAAGRGSLSAPRLYELIRQPGRIDDRTFEIDFDDPGAEAFVCSEIGRCRIGATTSIRCAFSPH
jgi:hypothetical protein